MRHAGPEQKTTSPCNARKPQAVAEKYTGCSKAKYTKAKDDTRGQNNFVEKHPAILPCGVTGEVPAPESEAAVEVAVEALPTSAEIEEG